jgi:carbonic anhydrase/acetyltransferase-like protein (isoleucine patch superfamily)
MIREFQGQRPRVAATAFIAESAMLIGDVMIGEESSVWYHSVLRGDMNFIRLGDRTNIQDLSVLHVRYREQATVVGNEVTVGHRVVLHGCTIGDRVLVGMGAIVMDGVVIGEDCVVGAGALVTPGTVVEPGSLVLGAPAKVKRGVTQGELDLIREGTQRYVEFARLYKEG